MLDTVGGGGKGVVVTRNGLTFYLEGLLGRGANNTLSRFMFFSSLGC